MKIEALLEQADYEQLRGHVVLMDEPIPVTLVQPSEGAWPLVGEYIQVAEPGDSDESIQAFFLEPLPKFN